MHCRSKPKPCAERPSRALRGELQRAEALFLPLARGALAGHRAEERWNGGLAFFSSRPDVWEKDHVQVEQG